MMKNSQQELWRVNQQRKCKRGGLLKSSNWQVARACHIGIFNLGRPVLIKKQ